MLSFQNDMTTFHSKDDVLTLLIHLGYLAYDEAEKKVYIPNLEVADSFKLAVRGEGWQEIEKAIMQSEHLLECTLNGDEKAVEKALDIVHAMSSSVLSYNDENSLSCAIIIAYYTARKDYTIVREFPTGKGFADVVFCRGERVPVRQ